jgi:hypothetical protein
MPLLIEQQTRDIGLVRTPLGPERTRVFVRPGDSFRFVDDAGQVPARFPNMRVRRLDNNLIVDGLPDGREIELNNFFGACRPGAECTVSLDGLGVAGTVVTEETAPIAPLSDGSFLLYADTRDAAALAAALPAAKVAEAAGPSWLAIGGVACGLAIAGAAAGGGGGGGGGSGPATDTTPPDAPVITSGPVIKRSAAIVTGEAEAGARVTLRVDVNGNGTFTDPADLSFSTIADANGRWQVDLRGTPTSGSPPAGGLGDGQYALLAQAVDAAQNASGSTRSTVTIDGVPPAVPTIAVVAGNDVVNAAERDAGIVVTGTAEAGSSVTVTVGAVSATTTATAAGTWTASFDGRSLTDVGLVAVGATATDAAGNASNQVTRQVVFETIVPGAPIISDNVAAITGNGPVTFTVTFDKPVTGITTDDLVVSGGTKGAFTAVSPTVYTLVVTPDAGQQSGQMILQVPAGAGVDAGGNPTPAANPGIQAYDTLAPVLQTIATGAAGAVNGPVTFTFTWSEAVAGFDASDVVIVGVPPGAVGTFTAVSASVYTLVVAPPAAATGTIGASVAAGTAADLAGNAVAGPASGSQAFDTQSPGVQITDPVAGTATGPVLFTFTFSEPVTGFTASDIVVSGGATVGTLNASSASVYTAQITPPAGTGSFTVDVPAAAVTDGAGNASTAAPQVSQAYAPPGPVTLSITDDVSGTVSNAAPTVRFTFTFGEPVSGFVLGDIVRAGGGTGTFGALVGSGTTYTLDYTAAAGEQGTVGVTVAAGAAFNGAGTGSAAASATQAYDRVATVAIGDDTSGTAAGPVTFTFTLSDSTFGPAPGSDFTISDITVVGGTPGTLTATGANTYTLVVTPPSNDAGTITVNVPAGAFVDAAGNSSTGASTTQVYNTNVAPTLVSITDNAAGVANGPVTYTFTWSEPVTGFDIADVSRIGAANNASGWTAVTATADPRVFTTTYTPLASESGTVSVSVPAGGGIVDASGAAHVASGITNTQRFVSAGAIVNETPGPGTVAPGGTSPDATPQVVVTLGSVLGTGDSLALLRSYNGGAFAQVESIGSGGTLTHDETTPLPAGTYDYQARYSDALGNVTVLDLTPGAGTDYRIVI